MREEVLTMTKKNACDWLRSYLSDGPKEVSDIRIAAKQEGFSRAELRLAKGLLEVQVTNNWSREHSFTDQWFWSLTKEVRI